MYITYNCNLLNFACFNWFVVLLALIALGYFALISSNVQICVRLVLSVKSLKSASNTNKLNIKEKYV